MDFSKTQIILMVVIILSFGLLWYYSPQLEGVRTQVLTPGLVATQCGNNRIDQGEQCDDGNLLNLDGCNSRCQIEVSEEEKAAAKAQESFESRRIAMLRDREERLKSNLAAREARLAEKEVEIGHYEDALIEEIVDTEQLHGAAEAAQSPVEPSGLSRTGPTENALLVLLAAVLLIGWKKMRTVKR